MNAIESAREPGEGLARKYELFFDVAGVRVQRSEDDTHLLGAVRVELLRSDQVGVDRGGVSAERFRESDCGPDGLDVIFAQRLLGHLQLLPRERLGLGEVIKTDEHSQ